MGGLAYSDVKQMQFTSERGVLVTQRQSYYTARASCSIEWKRKMVSPVSEQSCILSVLCWADVTLCPLQLRSSLSFCSLLVLCSGSARSSMLPVSVHSVSIFSMHTAVLHDVGAVAQRFHLMDVVIDQEDADALLL